MLSGRRDALDGGKICGRRHMSEAEQSSCPLWAWVSARDQSSEGNCLGLRAVFRRWPRPANRLDLPGLMVNFEVQSVFQQRLNHAPVFKLALITAKLLHPIHHAFPCLSLTSVSFSVSP